MRKNMKSEGQGWRPCYLSPEETMALFEKKGIRYEVCDTPVPVLANGVRCGAPHGVGDQTIEGYYYLPKSVVGLHPVVDIPAVGDSMIDADIHEGDLLRLEMGAVACDGDIVLAEIDNEYTAKVLFTDSQGQKWLCPMNSQYSAILLTEDHETRISGVVRSIVKKTVRRSFSECAAIVRRTKEQSRREGDVMQRLERAVREGCHLFWAASAWAVAYCVVRDCCGYEDSVSDFERKGAELTLPMNFGYECSAGKVQRTISNHPYMRLHIDKWRENGASTREIVLMEFLRRNM